MVADKEREYKQQAHGEVITLIASAQGGNKDPPRDRRKRLNGRKRRGGGLFI